MVFCCPFRFSSFLCVWFLFLFVVLVECGEDAHATKMIPTRDLHCAYVVITFLIYKFDSQSTHLHTTQFATITL